MKKTMLIISASFVLFTGCKQVTVGIEQAKEAIAKGKEVVEPLCEVGRKWEVSRETTVAHYPDYPEGHGFDWDEPVMLGPDHPFHKVIALLRRKPDESENAHEERLLTSLRLIETTEQRRGESDVDYTERLCVVLQTHTDTAPLPTTVNIRPVEAEIIYQPRLKAIWPKIFGVPDDLMKPCPDEGEKGIQDRIRALKRILGESSKIVAEVNP